MKKRTTLKKALIIVLILCMAYMILSSQAGAKGVAKGMAICVQSLIPSLFLFMIIADFTVFSDLKYIFGGVFGVISRKLFRCPKEYAFVLFFSLIGGYPVGAKIIDNMLENHEISEEQAQRMLCYCVNCSPAFIINAVGVGIFHSFRAGMIMWAAQIAASLTAANFVEKIPLSTNCRVKSVKGRTYINALVMSIKDSTLSMMNICGFVIAFSGFTEVLRESSLTAGCMNFIYDNFLSRFMSWDFFDRAVFGMIEINSGIFAGNADMDYMGLFTFLMGFGGISVIFQIISCINHNISFKPFIISRFAMGFYSAFIAEILKKYFMPQAVSAFCADGTMVYINSNSVIYTLCMVSMITMIMLSPKEFSGDIS